MERILSKRVLLQRMLSVIIVGLLCISTFSILAPQVKASPGVAPDVVCVPFHGQLAAVPHDAWIGKEVILKGTAHDADGDGTMTAYKWDFGDGFSTDWISGVNPYIIEAKHVYTGIMNDGTPYGLGKYFTAWLYVRDNELLEGKDSYFIAIREKTLDVEVNLAIDNGLWWLHKQQIRGDYPDGAKYGYWNAIYGYNVASTSACTEAFELQGHLPDGDVGEDPYAETVQRGLNYLFNQFHIYNVYQDPTYCPLGNPDTNGNGIGLGCYGPGEILYESGMALMTISSTGTPNRVATTGSANVVGRAYKDIVQDMIDWFAWGQNDPWSGIYEGGWRYQANYEYSDNSVSQWPVIGMEAAEKNFGSLVTVPSFVRPELAKWLSYSQNANGGFGYDSPVNWVNTAKTGAGCAMLSWIGTTTTDTKFQSALSFLAADWYNTASSYTNFGDYYTMYAIMKGMRIPNPNVVSIGSHDWYAEYARYIVDEQNNYGGEYVVEHSWLAGYLSAEHATAWALATLTLTVSTPSPVAEAGSDVENFPPTILLKFDASGSYHRDPAKIIVLYEWDFESDGTWDYSGTNLKVEHAYPAYTNPDGSIDWDLTAKDYTATLRVTDNSNPALQDTDTRVVHITAPPWKPVADPDGQYEGYVGAPIQLDGSKSYDPESKMYPPGHPWYETIAKYEWDLNNDGKFDDSVDVKPSYVWNSAGTYSVGLKVTDSQPSGPGGTIGPLDTDVEYTTVIIEQTPPKTINVTIVEVRAIDTMDPDDPLYHDNAPADFYARVSIDGVALSDSPIRYDDDDIYPGWSFSREVSKTFVPIHIEIWDRDPTMIPGGDDHVDINKIQGQRNLDLVFDTATQALSGDTTYGYSRGDKDGAPIVDIDRAEIWFNIGLDTGDKDGDGLFDAWETSGIHMSDSVVLQLPLANRNHKDIYLEIDWMQDVGSTHSHEPLPGVTDAVINAFKNSPVSNLDNVDGINLQIDVSNSVPHEATTTFSSAPQLSGSDFDRIKTNNFDHDRRFAYHYCLFAHSRPGTTSSGIAELPGNDFMVTLGSPGWDNGVGSPQQQEGTLMHEFGHNLNLRHGGGDDINYKPNYLSIMSYAFQTFGIPSSNRLDYSQSALPPLDENHLDETVGIQDGTDKTDFYDTNGARVSGQPGTGAIDWNRNNDGGTQTDVQADINNGPNGYNGPSKYVVLNGYDDWANINYSSLGTSDFEDGVHITSESIVELDFPTYIKISDATPPTTKMVIGGPKYVSNKPYVTSDTQFMLEATDTFSGVMSTAYRITNSKGYNGGWLTYTKPFNLTSLPDGICTIAYNSTDNAGNVEPTKQTCVTLFSWKYVFKDTYGRGTILKINTVYKFFQFITPSKDYGIRKATYMQSYSCTITIKHCDTTLKLVTTTVNTKTDYCVATAWDLKTRRQYLLVDRSGFE